MRILTAEYVLPISDKPIRRGAVVVDGGTIAAVGPLQQVTEQFPETAIDDYGFSAILPGFVNCHSHLEITAMRGALDDVEHDFRSWLLKLNDLRNSMSDDEIREAAYLGAVEGAAAGVTCFGDIGRNGIAGFEALKRAGLRGLLFQETEFSPDDRTADSDFAELREKYFALRESATELVDVGLSPHSPYTVSPKLSSLIADFAIENSVKISIHAAESEDEDELVINGNGFFTEVYEKFGLEWKSPGCSTIEYLKSTGILETKPLLAHCVTVSDTDIETIFATGSKIAHCPKSNAKFGHGYAPFERFCDLGVTVGLGSDSVASNNLCDMIEEGRFAALAARNRAGRKRFVTPREVLSAATIGGAAALGLEDMIGSLETGKQADLAIVSLDNPSVLPVNEIEAAIVFSSSGRDIKETIVAGTCVYKKEAR